MSAIGVSTVGLYTGKQVCRINLFLLFEFISVAAIGTNDKPGGCFLWAFNHIYGEFQEFRAASVFTYLYRSLTQQPGPIRTASKNLFLDFIEAFLIAH